MHTSVLVLPKNCPYLPAHDADGERAALVGKADRREMRAAPNPEGYDP
jgi:hypothetical protein